MKVTIIAGSNREKSTSTKLCLYIQQILEAKGYSIDLFDLYRKPLPFYSPDEEHVGNENVTMLKKSMDLADAIVLATPEYHAGPSGVLKNALDHLGGEHFNRKVVLSVSSSGGAVGTSSLLQLQAIVRNVHGINCPEWISIGGENRSFDSNGEPDNIKIKMRINKAIDTFIQMAEKLKE
jgi:azobenzene reductase